jgi:hypothetical protein
MITSFKNRIRLLILYIYMHLLTNNHVSWRTKSVPPTFPTDALTGNETNNLWCQAMAILLNVPPSRAALLLRGATTQPRTQATATLSNKPLHQ